MEMMTPLVSGHTRVISILGSPISQAMSPSLHNASFERLGVDCVCIAADVGPEALPVAIAGARALGFAGLIVTMPLKTDVVQYLDELSPAARLMGAVNTIVRDGNRFIGHNTDGAGMMRAVAEAGVHVAGQQMTVIGAGGAGSAICAQAVLDGVREVSVFNNRDAFFRNAQQRFATLAGETGATVTLFDLADTSQLARQVSNSALVVDATRVGMAPLHGQSNVAAEWLSQGQAVVDTVYVPRVTELLKRAAESGATAISGLEMLLWQAALAEELWFGVDMPVDYIREMFFEDQD